MWQVKLNFWSGIPIKRPPKRGISTERDLNLISCGGSKDTLAHAKFQAIRCMCFPENTGKPKFDLG